MSKIAAVTLICTEIEEFLSRALASAIASWHDQLMTPRDDRVALCEIMKTGIVKADRMIDCFHELTNLEAFVQDKVRRRESADTFRLSLFFGLVLNLLLGGKPFFFHIGKQRAEIRQQKMQNVFNIGTTNMIEHIISLNNRNLFPSCNWMENVCMPFFYSTMFLPVVYAEKRCSKGSGTTDICGFFRIFLF